MAEPILDGTGNGYKAKVNSKHQMSVSSVSVEEVTHISSTEGRTYEIHSERSLLAGSTIENIIYLEYTGEFQLQIDRILASKEDVALASGTQAVIEIYSGVTYTSGGTLVTPKNLNLGSSNIVNNIAYSGATTIVVGTANEEEIITSVFETVHSYAFKGALILKKGDAILVRGKSINIGDILRAEIFCYEVTDRI